MGLGDANMLAAGAARFTTEAAEADALDDSGVDDMSWDGLGLLQASAKSAAGNTRMRKPILACSRTSP